MNHGKIEALGRPRRSDAKPTRPLRLRQHHHFPTVSRMTESLFDWRDGLALLQQILDLRCNLTLLPVRPVTGESVSSSVEPYPPRNARVSSSGT